MADITSPQIVRFVNERARPFADALESAYLTAKRFQQELVALGVIPNTADNVADGSEGDGRKRATGAAINGLSTAADAMVGWFETGTPSRIVQIQRITVNGQARF